MNVSRLIIPLYYSPIPTENSDFRENYVKYVSSHGAFWTLFTKRHASVLALIWNPEMAVPTGNGNLVSVKGTAVIPYEN